MLENQNLIHEVIKNNFSGYQGVCEYDDLFQTGFIGLIKAKKRFDKERGYKFSTYAYYCIRNEIITFLNKNNRIPRHNPNVVNSRELSVEAQEIYDDLCSKLDDGGQYLKDYMFNNARYNKVKMEKIREKV